MREAAQNAHTWDENAIKQLTDSAVYVGQLNSKNNFHGLGSISWPDGRKYVGQWKDGTPDGNGVMTWVDASFYKGDFVDGLVSAFPFTLSDILCYITKNCILLQRHGKGVHTFADGGVYSGDFKEGQRHGKGRRIYADGRIYEGMWFNFNQSAKEDLCIDVASSLLQVIIEKSCRMEMER